MWQICHCSAWVVDLSLMLVNLPVVTCYQEVDDEALVSSCFKCYILGVKCPAGFCFPLLLIFPFKTTLCNTERVTRMAWIVMGGLSYMLPLLLSQRREATCNFFFSIILTHCTLRANRVYIKIIGCAASVRCAEGWSSYKAINHSWIECECGFLQGGSAVLPSWQLEYLKPAEVEAKKTKKTRRSGTDWAAGLEVRRPRQADGWQYTLLPPACPRLHTPIPYRHFLYTVCRVKLEGRKSTTWLSLMHFTMFFFLAFLSHSD